MPTLPMNATRLLTVCDGIIKAATPYEHRVGVTLDDQRTIHNAFPDRGFKP